MCTMADARKSGYFLVASLLVQLALLVRASDIKWDRPTQEVKQGDEFSMTCMLENIKIMELVRLVKESEGEPSEQMTIADMNDVKAPFKDTMRYHVAFKRIPSERKLNITLSFTGVRGEDAGRIGCHILKDNAEISWAELKVLVPINDMYIASRDTSDRESRHREGDMVDLREGEDTAVFCRATVNGSLTPPTLRMYVDGVDRTALFTAHPKDETKFNAGLPQYHSEMKLVYENQKPDASFNGKTLTCEAEMDGFEKRVFSTILMVEYAPIVICHKYEHYATLGRPMALGCDILSNPPATVSWTLGNGLTITSGQEDEKNKLEATETSLETTDKKEAKLEIMQVNQEHLGEYILKATNELGEKSVTLELRKASTEPVVKPQPDKSNSGDSNGSAPDPLSVTSDNKAASPTLWSMLASIVMCLVALITVT